MLNLPDARNLIARHVQLLDAERIPLGDALDRRLRETVATTEDIPAFDRSAMDGYALNATDGSERFRVIAEIPAGVVPTCRIGDGECARVFTGGAIPEGATQVVVQELAQRHGDMVSFFQRDAATNIRRRGEDARAGDTLLEGGVVLGPIELALLAQIGKVRPLVSPRPRILHVVTGSELVPPAESPGAGQIRDSNSTLIAALVSQAGGTLVAQRRAGDDLDTLLAAIRGVPEVDWQILLVSGGASVGDYDFGRRALDALGFQIHFDQLNLRPGKPLIFATRGTQIAFIVPGNPLSHFVCWHVVIRTALECLVRGAAPFICVALELGGSTPLRGHARETWWPARLRWEAAGPIAEPLRWQSSGDLTRLAGVNVLMQIPSDSPPIAPGEKLSALLLGAPF
ncbi:MAG: molybdopterin molybdotransferase MoeA [Chthoniobacteraceae bacterium]